MTSKKKYQLNTSDESLIKFIESHSNVSQFIKETLEQLKKGELLPKEKAEQTQRMIELKLREKTAKIINLEINAKRNMIHDLHVPPSEVAKVMNEKSNIINLNRTKKIIQPDNTLMCLDCGKVLQLKAFRFEQSDDLEKHMKIMHNRGFDEEEKMKLMEFLGC